MWEVSPGHRNEGRVGKAREQIKEAMAGLLPGVPEGLQNTVVAEHLSP